LEKIMNSTTRISSNSALRGLTRRTCAIAATAVGLSATATFAHAADFYFDVVNSTTQAIVNVWVSPVSSGSWGAPFKGVFVPQSGGRQRLEFSYGSAYSTTCNFDVKVRFAGGQTNYWNSVDLCTTNGLDVDVSLGKVVAMTF
jgi:hypothetical protein